jgi:hypothetical protein
LRFYKEREKERERERKRKKREKERIKTISELQKLNEFKDQKD